MENNIKAASAARKNLKFVSYELQNMAKAAKLMGNNNLAKNLTDLSFEVNDEARKLHDAWSNEFNHHCDSIQSHTSNLLVATFAGMKLGQGTGKRFKLYAVRVKTGLPECPEGEWFESGRYGGDFSDARNPPHDTALFENRGVAEKNAESFGERAEVVEFDLVEVRDE